MAAGYAKRVKEILAEHGCTFVRHDKRDHDIWQSLISGSRFVVDAKIPLRHLANAVLRGASRRVGYQLTHLRELGRDRVIALPPDEQFLVATGRTYFRGLSFDDLQRVTGAPLLTWVSR